MHTTQPKAATDSAADQSTGDVDQHLFDLSWVTEDVFPLAQDAWGDDGSLTAARDIDALAGGIWNVPHQHQRTDNPVPQHAHKPDTDQHLLDYGFPPTYTIGQSRTLSSGLPSGLLSSSGSSFSHRERHAPKSQSSSQPSPPAQAPAPPPPTISKRTAKKRIRIAADGANDDDDDDEGSGLGPHAVALPPSAFVPPDRALRNLAASVAESHPLQHASAWAYTQKNCFLMTPLDTIALDYFKHPLQFSRFAIHVIDPSQPANIVGELLPLAPSEDEHQSNFTIARPAGRSVHLLVTMMPELLDRRLVDRGFALIVACRCVDGVWVPQCLASFEGTAQSKARGRSNEVAFKANVEHCVDEASGRRIWGQRTSHVRRKAKDSLKAIRIQPKGPVGLVEAEEYCFFVALFDLDTAALLHHADGTPCIARSNIVVFEPKDTAEQDEQSLLYALRKLTLFERADLVALPGTNIDLRTAVTTPDAKLLHAVGVNTYDATPAPATAVPLSSFDGLSNPQASKFPPFSDAYTVRIRAVARAIGWHHADASLTDPSVRTLECLNVLCAYQRYTQITRAGIEEARAWVRSAVGEHAIGITAAERRAEMANVLMKHRRFRSTWTVGMHNPYPDRILVDRDDVSKVHCLADTTHEADVGLRDRMQSLIRITYCTRVPPAEMEECIFAPYVEGFQSRRTTAVERRAADGPAQVFRDLHAGHPINGPLIELEKFRLLLHVMHLYYYLYWVHFRNAASVRRITRRLLDEERGFPKEYFQTAGFIPLGQGQE